MRTALLMHWNVLQSTFRRLARTPLASLLNILVIGIALSLPTGGYVLLKNVQTLAAQAAGEAEITVFLDIGTSSNDIARISEKLKEHAAIERIEFVPRDLALRQLQESTGLTEVSAGLEKNPLPDAFIIHPVELEPEQLELLRDDLSSWPKFEHVQLDSAWARKLKALLQFAGLAVWILAALLSFALVAITFNTIRLQILTQREEIEVSKLIGATDAFIRRPFLYFGLTQGVLGGLAAWLVVWISLLALNQSLLVLSQSYAVNLQLHYLPLADSLSLLGFAALLGWLGAWLSVSQHLWKIEPR